jgi:hypothetical protein
LLGIGNIGWRFALKKVIYDAAQKSKHSLLKAVMIMLINMNELI